MPRIRPVLLSGGSGTRLWPLSTPELPKQFASLMPGPSLFERTLLRLSGETGVSPPVVVLGSGQLEMARRASVRVGVDIGLAIVEPEGRNTAPAALAAALASDPDDILVILPSDHLIEDEQGFVRSVRAAVKLAAEGHIVTFGVTPRSPETGYGYIEKGEAIGGAFRIRRFKEKPDLVEAERMLSDGHHLWNSGIFVVVADLLIAEARKLCPEVLQGVDAAMSGRLVDQVGELGPAFTTVEAISLDNAIMERTSLGAVIPIDVGWDDLGSFHALWQASGKDDRGNVISGEVSTDDVSGSLIRSTSRKLAVAGMRDVVVVETAEAVLVVPRGLSQRVKALLEGFEPD